MAVADTFQALMSPSESQTQAFKATCLSSFSFKLAFAFLFSVSFSTFLPHPGFGAGGGGEWGRRFVILHYFLLHYSLNCPERKIEELIPEACKELMKGTA